MIITLSKNKFQTNHSKIPIHFHSQLNPLKTNRLSRKNFLTKLKHSTSSTCPLPHHRKPTDNTHITPIGESSVGGGHCPSTQNHLAWEASPSPEPRTGHPIQKGEGCLSFAKNQQFDNRTGDMRDPSLKVLSGTAFFWVLSCRWFGIWVRYGFFEWR